jgi:hypothetical protein
MPRKPDDGSTRSPVEVTAFDVWVGENNPDPKLEYGKGWWDYVETLRRLITKFDAKAPRVIGIYVVHTPPPCEELPMPAVAFTVDDTAFALKYDFGSGARWPQEWTVSVKRPQSDTLPVMNLFDGKLDLSSEPIEGLGPEWTFPAYANSPASFTCEVEDEWDVAALIRLFTS